jgi:hypothetical protein
MFRNEERRGPDRRSEPRYRVNEPAVLKSTDDIAAVRILDISAIGLRVSGPGPMPLNTEVEVRFGGAKVPGFVKNCRCIRASEFHLGILTAPVADSEDQQPARLDHLPLLRRAKMINGGIAIDRRATNIRSRTA